jgi:hypothetical protein
MSDRSVGADLVTLGQLEEALKSLGFKAAKTEQFTAFRDIERDALIILPVMEPDEVVDEPHLVAVRNTVVGKGVALPEQFRARLFHATTNGAKSSGRR